MKTIEQLETTTGDVATSEIFSDAIEEAAAANRVMRGYIRTDDSLKEGSKTLHIPKSEGALPGSVAQTNDSTVSPSVIGVQDISVQADTFSIGSEIHEDVVKETNYGILDHTVTILGKSLAEHEDQQILEKLSNFSGGTIDATSGVTFSGIQSAKQAIEEKNFQPDLLVVNPNTEAQIGTIPEFGRASWYGSPTGESYVETGKIGEILGMDLVVTTNIFESGGTASCIMTDSQHSVLQAIQSSAETRQKFETFDQTHQILANQRFGVAELSADATQVIQTT